MMMNRFLKNTTALLCSLAIAFCTHAQSANFDLLKFKAPAEWQQQMRAGYASFTSTGAEGGITEIVVYNSQPAAPRIDSSFRMEWRRILDDSYGNPAVMPARKRGTSSGISYVENGAEMMHNGQKTYVQLMVFSLDDQVQTIQLIASDLAAYKKSRDFIYDFLDSVDTVKKRKD